jgi:hypothetical protein
MMWARDERFHNAQYVVSGFSRTVFAGPIDGPPIKGGHYSVVKIA